MTVTIAEIIQLLQTGKIRVNPTHSGRWWQIGGDINALEHGGRFARFYNSGIDLYDFDGNSDESDDTGFVPKYTMTDHSVDVSELIAQFDQYGAELDQYEEYQTIGAVITTLLDRYVSKGDNVNDYMTGYATEMYFNPMICDWAPSDLFFQIDQ